MAQNKIISVSHGPVRYTAPVVFAAALFVTGVAVPTLSGEARADASKFFQHEAFRNDTSSRAERRRQRELIRDALRARLEPEFHSNVPYVSQQTIAAVQRAIARYRAIVQGGGWQQIPSDRTLRINDSGDSVKLLRRRLLASGDLRSQARKRSWAFDAALEEAVARFQLRHGLRVTGFLDIRTRRALNVPAHVRLRQLQTNLARLTELMKINKAKRYVLVNVPSYQLQAVEEGHLALKSSVVVGKPSRETPSISVKIRGLNFYPYWRVPHSISSKDLIPHIRKDPSYFYKEKFSLLPAWGAKPFDPKKIDWNSPDVYKYKFRQDPGQHNALGVVRIDMPNKHIVYLHDTPLKQLFGQSSRAFSSGCVRVEHVLDLASWLLKDEPKWDPLRVQVTVAQGKPENVKLKKPVPVHFVYVTAWATNQGIAHFRPDIYSRDGGAVEIAQNAEGLPASSRAISP